MLKLNLATLLLVSLATTIHGADLAFRSADQNLMQFMLRSSALSQQNPTRSVSCFDYYIPLLNGITSQYETEYAACLSTADARRSEVDSSTQPEREAVAASAQGACDALNACNQQQSAVPYFECYVNAGGDNTKVLYAIQQNSSTILDVVREDYRLIENDQNRCTNASERAYVQNTANTYEELQSCLQGKTPVPTTTTTTTAAPTPEPEPEPEPTTVPEPEVHEQPEQQEPENPEEPGEPVEPPQ